VSGLRDTGSASNVGVATSFHCTNFSAVAEKIRFVLRDFPGTVVANTNVDVPAFGTRTASTHNALVFNEDSFLSPGAFFNQGSAVIQSTSLNVHCSGMIVDAAASVPQGIALHMIRLNPAPGTQE
jgi:hypothetical protein